MEKYGLPQIHGDLVTGENLKLITTVIIMIIIRTIIMITRTTIINKKK